MLGDGGVVGGLRRPDPRSADAGAQRSRVSFMLPLWEGLPVHTNNYDGPLVMEAGRANLVWKCFRVTHISFCTNFRAAGISVLLGTIRVLDVYSIKVATSVVSLGPRTV